MSHTALKHTITLTILALQKRGTGKFKLLDSDGLCAVGESIENGDYYINKISPTNTKDLFPMGPGGVLPDHMYKPTPMSYKGSKGETSVVDKVLLTQNDENEEIIKVRKFGSISNYSCTFQQMLCSMFVTTRCLKQWSQRVQLSLFDTS